MRSHWRLNDVDDGLREHLDAEINAFNVAATGYADAGLVCIAARDDGGNLCAGLSGWTWGGCAYIEFLWVREDHRGSGLGSRLLAMHRGAGELVARAENSRPNYRLAVSLAVRERGRCHSRVSAVQHDSDLHPLQPRKIVDYGQLAGLQALKDHC